MEKFRKYYVLCAAMMINCVLNRSTYFGNLSTYIYSIHYKHRNSNSFDIDPSWMFPMYLINTGIGVFLVNFMQKRVGLRLTCGFGIILFVAGTFLTYFTVSYSVWATTLTFMVIGGLGNGVAGVCNMMFAATCFGSNVGLATSILKSTTALSGVLMNFIITSYINPNNLSPDDTQGQMRFFSQSAIIDRVPVIFLILGGICAGCQITGLCCLMNVTDPSSNEKSRLLDKPQNVEQEKSFGRTESPLGLYNSPALNKQTARRLSSSGDFERHRIKSNGESDKLTISRDKKSDSSEDEIVTNAMTPSQVLKSGAYYVLLCAYIPECVGFVVATNYFKLFGQLWIKDDQFMAFIGSCSSLCVVVFYLACGILADRVGIKNTHIVHLAISSIFFSLWYFTALMNKWLYLVWTLILYGSHNNQNLLSFLSSLEMFSGPHFARNFGLVEMAPIAVYMVGPSLIAFLLSTFGWFWMFFATGCVSFFGFLITNIKMASSFRCKTHPEDKI